MRRAIAALCGLTIACGSTAAGTTTPEPARPTGPAPTVMYVPADVSIRIDVTALRVSPLGPDLSAAYERAGLFSTAVGAGGVDPVEALECVAVTARGVTFGAHGLLAPRWRIAARHRLGAAGVRDALERMARAAGAPLVWRDSQGVPSARLPESSSVHAMVLDGESEVAVGPDDELGEVIRAVRDHAARRIDGETIEPSLLLPAGVVVDASLGVLPAFLQALGLSTLTVQAVSVEGGLRIVGLAGTAPGADPAAVTASLEAELARLRGNALMVSLGVDGLLERLVLTADPAGVRFETSGGWNEMRSLLAIVVAAAG